MDINNLQNTIAGTSNGDSLVATNGSPFMDFFTGLSNVATSGLQSYSNFQDAENARKIAAIQAVQKPAQTTPNYLISSPADLLSDPARLQQIFLYVSLAALATASLLYIIKKV